MALALAIVPSVLAVAQEAPAGLEPGDIALRSAGPIAFAPEGVLLASDPLAATIYAIATGDTAGNPAETQYNVEDLQGKVAAMLGATPADIQISDLAVNPLSGVVYLSVSRGSGPQAAAILLRVNPAGEISELSLTGVRHAKATLANAPTSGRQQVQAITDIAFADGKVLVAGLSTEEFSSKLRTIPYPFREVDAGASVEIFHASHDAVETNSPIMTFAPYSIGDQTHVLAAYTCTPLVKFRVEDLKAGQKVTGTTIAELGNRNRPLDMFVYEKEGKDFILMANSSRGVMKITTDNIGQAEAITTRVPDTAGLAYETIDALAGVTQLDKLNATTAVALLQAADGKQTLKTVALP
jgi:hypothetical protein